MEICHLGLGEQPLELVFYQAIGNITLCNQPPTTRIGVQGELVREHINRKASILRIPFAVVLVDENGTGQGQVFPSMEGVVGKQDSPLLSDGEGSQTLAARPITFGYFRVR